MLPGATKKNQTKGAQSNSLLVQFALGAKNPDDGHSDLKQLSENTDL